jgi:hypothetical protein
LPFVPVTGSRDYRLVFNTIVPSKLITKPRILGLNTSLCNWILDFLMGSPQVVRVGSNNCAKLKARNTPFNQGKVTGNMTEYKQCSYCLHSNQTS